VDHHNKLIYPYFHNLVEQKRHSKHNLLNQNPQKKRKRIKKKILPLKLFPHARNVKPRIVLLIPKTIPNVVNKLTISFATEYIQTTDTAKPRKAKPYLSN
jgi:hypothetical protein